MATERIGTMPNFPYSKATLACWRLIQQLRRSDVEAAAGVANVLDACSTARPCWSAACPVCGGAFQEVMVAIGDQYIRTLARSVSNRAHALVIVQSTGCVAPGHLRIGVLDRRRLHGIDERAVSERLRGLRWSWDSS